MALFKITPLTAERWRHFKANRRGFVSLWIFALLCVVTLFAELIANDKPLIVSYQGQLYFPVFMSYPETTFEGDFETETNYRDPFFKKQLTSKKGWALWPLLPYHHTTVNMDLPVPAPSPPTWENPLGTDDQGRDVMARFIYGFRISVLFGVTLTLISSVLSIIAGSIQGYFGGKIDLIFQRVMEVWSGIPPLYLLMILGNLVQPNFWWLLGFLLLFSWMSLVGLVRAEFLRARNFDYVRAAQALGVSTPVLMYRHILPNAMVATLTYIPFILSSSITTLTALDFLGFGLPPGSPSLGEMLAQGKNTLQAPWLGIVAFCSVALTLCLLTFIGEAVRDAFDPRKANR